MDSDVNDGPPYKVQVSISGKYRPLILRGHMLHEQTPKSAFPEKRKAGNTNLDLWVDGLIYPTDSSGKRPRFRDVKSLLEFVSEGENGLLGYTKSLLNSRQSQLDLQRERAILENENMRQSIEELSSSLLQQRNELERIRETNSRLTTQSKLSQRQVERLQSEIILVQNNLNFVKEKHVEELADLRKELEESMQAEIALESDIDVMSKEHAEAIQLLDQSRTAEIATLKLEHDGTLRSLSKLQSKWERLRSTPYGYRKQVRKRRDLSMLSQTGGQAKAMRRLARSILAPTSVQEIQTSNALNQKKQRLYGTKEQQIESGKLLAKILSKTEVKSMLETPALKSVGIDVTNMYLDKIGEAVGVPQILGTCDRSGITQDGYAAVYKQMKGGAKTAGRGLRIGCLPKPYHVSILRRELNAKLIDFVGDYYSLNSEVEFQSKKGSKKKDLVHVKLTEHNSFFVDVEQVQRTMVELYRITPEGIPF